MNGPIRTLAAPIAALILLAGCGGSDDPQPSAAAPVAAQTTPTPSPTARPAAPTVEGARELAEEASARYGAGDWSGAWELWAPADQRLVPRDVYVAVKVKCSPGSLPLTVEDVRLDGPTTAVVRISVLTFAQAYTIPYVDGAWRWHNLDADLAKYAGGTDAAVARLAAEGQCDGAQS